MNQPVFAICQIDPTVGDLEGNANLILASAAEARNHGAAVAVFPELSLTGYPPEDLLLHPHFVAAAERTAGAVIDSSPLPIIFGSVDAISAGVCNVAIAGGPDVETARYAKCRLPNYGVFDERRYFEPGSEPVVVDLAGCRVGLSICEDIWHAGEPTASTVAAGAEAIVNISASPFHAGKFDDRFATVAARAREHSVPVLYSSLCGAQDELVFDGRSFAVDAAGNLLARASAFAGDLLLVDPTGGGGGRVEPSPVGAAEVERALEIGLSDYVGKNGFDGVVFGISGGIDSAVVATLAVGALGADRVHAAVMPSPWSSPETQADARILAANLGIQLFEFPIEPAMKAAEAIIGDAAEGPGSALAAENIQARIRGNLLMALSNTHGWLVITTGNKSELAVGYSTLYGDAAGGFGLLKDVPKHLVYDLARLRNARADSPIPATIIKRPPSAELKPAQKDEDSLPPYDRLDDILQRYVERREDAAAIAASGHEPAEVERILRMVDLAEYKRRQYPPGVKITPLAFGKDRRMPMTNGWINSVAG